MVIFGVWKPYFSEENIAVITATSARYVHMLQTFVQPNCNSRMVKYGLNGTGPPRTHHVSPAKFQMRFFPSRIIPHRDNLSWPTRFDLEPAGFCLWAYLKAKIYSDRPPTINTLKEAIRVEVANKSPKVTARVMDTYSFNHVYRKQGTLFR
ncbi:hypothetical protein Trydic_g7369 [Trypoxylus dichotomus]